MRAAGVLPPALLGPPGSLRTASASDNAGMAWMERREGGHFYASENPDCGVVRPRGSSPTTVTRHEGSLLRCWKQPACAEPERIQRLRQIEQMSLARNRGRGMNTRLWYRSLEQAVYDAAGRGKLCPSERPCNRKISATEADFRSALDLQPATSMPPQCVDRHAD